MEKVADNKYQQVAAILRKAAADAGLILVGPGDELHQIQIKNTLEREASRILLITGSGDLHASEIPVLGPAKTIGGEPIKKLRKFTEADMVPSDDKLFQLKQEVNSAIEYFRVEGRTPESLIAQIPDLVIRGVAKKVGMTVTKDDPKVLSPEFVAEIQEKVREQFTKKADLPDDDGEDEFEETENFSEEAGINDTETAPPVITELTADAEKQQLITDLERKADEASKRNEALRIELASEPNKNKRTAIRKQITDAENEIASLKKQLEDANKD